MSSAAGLVLLIGCANLANMLLARTRRREREIGLHAALGATRLRIVRPIFFETVIVGIAAAVLALLVTALTFELGFGVGANFVSSGLLDLVDFDTPEMDPTPTSSVFTVLNHQPDTLDWSGGTTPAISSVAFTFAIDVPDGLTAFNPSGQNRFTLRDYYGLVDLPQRACGRAAFWPSATETLSKCVGCSSCDQRVLPRHDTLGLGKSSTCGHDFEMIG